MVIGRLMAWWRGRAKTPSIPDELWRETLDQLPFLSRLSDEECVRLRALSEAFLAEKEFTAVGGLKLTDAMCVSIAAQGCLPILNLGLDYYRDWIGIVVYPDEFVIPRTVEDEFGVVHEYDDIASGEAWEGGPLIISWHDVQMAGGGYNVVIHEFAHKLDMRNGEADGIPSLPPELSRSEWESTLLAAYEDFRTKVYVLDTAPATLADGIADSLPLDPYAAENPAEFFAVASEIFFEAPNLLTNHYPALYTLLKRYFMQDPQQRTH